MPAQVTDEERRLIDEQGFAKIADIGGQPKKRYWTPDGREMWAMPDIHTFARRNKDGKVIEHGTRDANLDQWLTEKPKAPKPYCPHCDKWHDNQKQIDACGESRQKLVSKSLKAIQTEAEADTYNRLNKLEEDMGDIKSMLKRLLEKK